MKRSGTAFGWKTAIGLLALGCLGWTLGAAQPERNREEILKRASGLGQTGQVTPAPGAPSYSPAPEIEERLKPKEATTRPEEARSTSRAYLDAIVMAGDEATTREIVPPEKKSLPGQVVRLNTGVPAELYIPAGWKPAGSAVDVVVHFHGAPWIVEQDFEAAGVQAALVVVNPGGRGSQYSEMFRDPGVFESILEAALDRVKSEGIAPADAEWGKMGMTAFSAGYGAVREILYTATFFNRIDAVGLADALHTRFADEASSDSRAVDPDQIRPFAEFARLAVEGKKTLVITRSSILPIYYTGTPETAAWLIHEVGGKEQPVTPPGKGPDGMKLIARYDEGNFHVRGYAGIGAADHMQHLYTIDSVFAQLPFPRK